MCNAAPGGPPSSRVMCINHVFESTCCVLTGESAVPKMYKFIKYQLIIGIIILKRSV